MALSAAAAAFASRHSKARSSSPRSNASTIPARRGTKINHGKRRSFINRMRDKLQSVTTIVSCANRRSSSNASVVICLPIWWNQSPRCIARRAKSVGTE